MNELEQKVEELTQQLVATKNQLLDANAKLEGGFDTRMVAFAKMPYSALAAFAIVVVIFALGVWVG